MRKSVGVIQDGGSEFSDLGRQTSKLLMSVHIENTGYRKDRVVLVLKSGKIRLSFTVEGKRGQ